MSYELIKTSVSDGTIAEKGHERNVNPDLLVCRRCICIVV
jgi:hypothetical protein